MRRNGLLRASGAVMVMAACWSVSAWGADGANQAASVESGPSAPPVAALPADLPADIRAYAQHQPEAVQRHLLMRTETQSQYALAQQARARHDAREASFWIDQLRTSALIAKQSPVPGTDAFGDRWLLQADMLNIRHLPSDLESRQRQAIFRLERYIAEQEQPNLSPSDTRTAAVRDAKVVLLGLYDQRGQSRQARALYEQLLASQPELTPALHEGFGYLEQLGQPVEGVVFRTDRGEPWSVTANRGNVVLIHFWSDWYEPSGFMFDALRSMYQRYKDKRVAMLSVNVSSLAAGVAGRASWPTARLTVQEVAGLRGIGVSSLPRLVLIDGQGRLAAVGSSLAVLDQVGPLVVEAHAGPR
jgi:hypothetical protein